MSKLIFFLKLSNFQFIKKIYCNPSRTMVIVNMDDVVAKHCGCNLKVTSSNPTSTPFKLI